MSLTSLPNDTTPPKHHRVAPSPPTKRPSPLTLALGDARSKSYIEAFNPNTSKLETPSSPSISKKEGTSYSNKGPKATLNLDGLDHTESETDGQNSRQANLQTIAKKESLNENHDMICYRSHSANLSLKQLDSYLHDHHHEEDMMHHLMHSAKKLAIMIFATAAIFGFVIVLFGVIPLGEPNSDDDDQKLVWLLVSNPIVFTTLNLLITMIFFSILDEKTPWHHWSRYMPIILITYLFQAGIMSCIYPFTNTFEFMGLVPLVISMVTSLVMLKLSKGTSWSTGSWCDCGFYAEQLSAYMAVVVAVFMYIIVLSLWLLAYREGSSVTQGILPFVLLLLVFGWKKYLLAKTDHFPVVIAMLISGFWIENLDDMFQTMVFPSVDSEVSAYITLWVRKFGENLAYLLFLTERWFIFRVWIKDFLKHLFKRHTPHQKPINEDVDELDRGHSNIRPAYWRRQVQFLMYKIISQTIAFAAYLIITPQLRDEKANGRYYPFQEATSLEQKLDNDSFENSLIFAGVSLVTTVMTGVAAYWLIWWYRRETYNQIMGSYGQLFRRPKYYGFMSLILLSNMLIAFNTIQYHNRIWFFKEDEPGM